MVAYTDYATDPRVIREAEAAVHAGYLVDFICLRKPHEPAAELMRGVRVIRLSMDRYRGGSGVRYLASYLEFFIRCLVKTAVLHFRHPYSVVHVNNMPDFMVFTALVPKLGGAGVILDIHDPMPETLQSKFKLAKSSLLYRLLLLQEKLSARFSNRLVTVHEPVKNSVLLHHGHPDSSIVVISNFADDDIFRLRPTIPDDGRIRLLFHGTILERSGLRHLMVALSQTRHRDRISAKIIGEGDYSAGLKSLIASLGLGNTVEFVHRVFPVSQIPSLIEDCNVGIVPLEVSAITNHAVPLKLLEYISLGMPVIAVRNSAITHYFREEDCLFYEPNNIDSLRDAIDRMAGEPGLLQHYRARAVAIRERFLWSTERKRYAELLHELARN